MAVCLLNLGRRGARYGSDSSTSEGKQHQRVLGTVRREHSRSGEGMSRTQAEKVLRDFRSQVEQGSDDRPEGLPGLNIATTVRVRQQTCICAGLKVEGARRGRSRGTTRWWSAHIEAFFSDRLALEHHPPPR